MAANLLSLVANSDCRTLASVGFITHGILKPIKFELEAANALMIHRRRNSMRELFELDFEQQRAEFCRLNLIIAKHNCIYPNSPLDCPSTQH